MKHRAISYLRYSSKGQARGDSERRQEESFNRWLLQNSDKYTAYEPFRDLGRSGYSGGHLASGGSLGRLLQQAKDGVFGIGDLLVVEAIDRLSRLEPLEAIELYQEILKTGLSILTLEDNQVYSTESLNSGGFALLTLVIKSQASHEYSKRLGSRIKSAHEKKRISAEAGEAAKVVGASWLKDGKLYEPIAILVRKAMGLQVSKEFELSINELTEKIAKCEERFQRSKKLYIDYGEVRAEVDFLQLKNELESLNIERDVLLLDINQNRKNNGDEFTSDRNYSIRCDPWEAADDIGKRKILKEAEYSIDINKKNAECWYSNKVWNIIKRNQKSRTYTLEEKIKGEEDSIRFIAINDEGREVANAASLVELSQLLDTEITN